MTVPADSAKNQVQTAIIRLQTTNQQSTLNRRKVLAAMRSNNPF